jgi:secreted protein with Ig-like and vWFA domain
VADPARTRTIILLTDGRSNPQPVADAVTSAAAAKARGVVIFTVGIGDDLDVDALRAIASQERYFFRSPDAADLEQIYSTIATLIPCAGSYWPRE